MDDITKFINKPEHRDVLAIVKGFRNGAVYGAKVRLPHALVMTLLFRSGSFKEKLTVILDATIQHSKNLAFFVTIYKTLMYLQKKINGGIEQNGHSFIAGLIGGYIIFGENNNINQQIVLYVFARIMVGLSKLPVKRKMINEPNHTFPVFAAVVWGVVMWLFRHDREVLQPSLQASMQYLYLDSDHWSTLKNFLWHNK
ncbi:peroxisomal membrane protein 4 [Gigaspora rosea]|uniref:Peroxisomal membrane protein 4 n=1 Tax=Gigaspora rosea TaxID=44941 RepID=A0A397U038_9GLOM|nr:peroxisomal membrane protein 4 [Gigaspora rosea]CAG8641595.1 19573_t:CDS:2 [Gigaspora rosea]